MKKICEVLASTPLFEGLDHGTFHDSCTKTSLRLVWKGEMIAVEGDECTGVGTVIEGQLAMQKYTSSGECATLGILGPGDMIGESMIYGHARHYPVTIEAVTHSKVLMIPRDTLQHLLETNPALMRNFLSILSDRVCSMNRRISMLSQKTLRQKIAFYLLDLWQEQVRAEKGIREPVCSMDPDVPPYTPPAPVPGRPVSRALATPAVELPVSKEVVARLLSMPRPSLSRELIAMETDGLIKVSGRVIWLVDVPALEKGVVEGFRIHDDE